MTRQVIESKLLASSATLILEFDVGNRLRTIINALEKVLHMVFLGCFSLVQPDHLRTTRLIQFRDAQDVAVCVF